MAQDLLDNAALASALLALNGWQKEGNAIVKVYDCKTFPSAAALLMRALLLAERMDHHPDVDLRYSKLRILLSSHDVGGISQRDVKFAQKLDEAAAK